MRIHLTMFPRSLPLLTLVLASSIASAQDVKLTPSHPDGLYAVGEPIAWDVTVKGEIAPSTQASYKLKLNGKEDLASGALDLAQPHLRVEAPALTAPGAVLAEVTVTVPDKKPVKVLGGAVADPFKIQPVLTRPDDFDQFWATQLAALAKVAPNPVVEPGESGRPGVDYFKVTLDNVDGAKIHTQLARPTKGEKFPALVIVQWAGVYGLKKEFVTGHAAEGWLVINVLPHDLPLDESDEFFKQQSAGPLKDYASIGNESRETSYFRKMFLGAHRAADYLTSRPDWDGKILVANGGSQGGYQSVVIAALDQRFTAVVAAIPAGCEITGGGGKRAGGWPSWNLKTSPAREAIIETSRYFDTVNFASRVHVPALIGLGLIDTTCPPSGTLSMYNQLAGPKNVVIAPGEGHPGPHQAYDKRAGAWLKALRTGAPLPLDAPGS